MMRIAALAPLLLLAACKPPATDDYAARQHVAIGGGAPSAPIDSPDTTDAIWAPAARPDRVLFGIPGQQPLMALECLRGAAGGLRIGYTRFAAADPHAEAVLALIGNGHVSRLWIDARESGGKWLWQGEVPAHEPMLDVFTGGRQVEATVPGAGSVMLKPSPLPGELVTRCRALAPPPQPTPQPTPTPSPVSATPAPLPPAGPA